MPGAPSALPGERGGCRGGERLAAAAGSERQGRPAAVTYFSDSDRRSGRRRPVPPPIYTNIQRRSPSEDRQVHAAGSPASLPAVLPSAYPDKRDSCSDARQGRPAAVTYFSDGERRSGKRRPMPPPISTNIQRRLPSEGLEWLLRRWPAVASPAVLGLVARGGPPSRPAPVSLG